MILLTDSISQSSNFCWIVLDETTYYISAFAVDSNGTIIDVQTMSITTDFIFAKYQKVEYIQSDINDVQYINTGYLPTYNPKIELDFMYINGKETTDYYWFDIYGRRGSTNSTYIGMYINNTNGYVSPNYAGFDPGQNSGVIISKNTRYYHIQDRGQFYLNGTKYANASTTNTLATSNYPVFLFGNNMQGTVQGRVKSMRVYSCKMWNDGALVRDFVPCYRKSDNVIGLLDIVNKVFYTNQGTGSFTKGPNVN